MPPTLADVRPRRILGGMAGCPFCEIVRGERDAERVLEDEVAVAFLDHRPLFEGHVLLVPREHHETLGELPEGLVAPLFLRARRLARAVQAALEAPGSFVAMNNRVSQSVPHLHVHVVPRRPKDGLKGFFWPRTRYREPGRAAEVAARIRQALAEDTAP